MSESVEVSGCYLEEITACLVDWNVNNSKDKTYTRMGWKCT